MSKKDDDASNYTMGDAIRDSRELEALTYTEVLRQPYGKDEDRAQQLARALRNVAKQEKNGSVVEVENTGTKRNPNWTIIVSQPVRRRKK